MLQCLNDALDLLRKLEQMLDSREAVTHLKEPLQPPDLESAVGTEYEKLEDTPPLYSRVGALSSVPVCPLAYDNVALLVLDLGNEL